MNNCIVCGNQIPEGRQVCPLCELGEQILCKRSEPCRKGLMVCCGKCTQSNECQIHCTVNPSECGYAIYEHSNTDNRITHSAICSQLTNIYERKNADYGDSFAKLRKEIPSAILVRIYDKYSRLKTLLSGQTQQVNDESIDDTLMDLANYCILELIERRK